MRAQLPQNDLAEAFADSSRSSRRSLLRDSSNRTPPPLSDAAARIERAREYCSRERSESVERDAVLELERIGNLRSGSDWRSRERDCVSERAKLRSLPEISARSVASYREPEGVKGRKFSMRRDEREQNSTQILTYFLTYPHPKSGRSCPIEPYRGRSTGGAGSSVK